MSTAPMRSRPGAKTLTATYLGYQGFDSSSDTEAQPVNLPSATINVTVLPVNDAPSFTRGADQTAGQGGGVRTVDGWGSAITTGPANEAGQTVSFIVSSNNRNLFSAQPAIAPNGTLTFTPAAVASGVATVTVTAVDNGGTDNGGFDSSASQTFTITISGTGNVPPSFTAGANVTVDEDAGAFVPVNNAGGGRNQHTATRLADGRVLMNDRVYRVNDVVDRTLGIKLITVAVDTLTFADPNGVVYVKHF